MGKYVCKTRRGTFKFGDLVHLILEILRCWAKVFGEKTLPGIMTCNSRKGIDVWMNHNDITAWTCSLHCWLLWLTVGFPSQGISNVNFEAFSGVSLNSSPPEQNVHHLVENIFVCILVIEKFYFLFFIYFFFFFWISHSFVSNGQVDNGLVPNMRQAIIWNKKWLDSLTHICSTRGIWVDIQLVKHWFEWLGMWATMTVM